MWRFAHKLRRFTFEWRKTTYFIPWPLNTNPWLVNESKWSRSDRQLPLKSRQHVPVDLEICVSQFDLQTVSERRAYEDDMFTMQAGPKPAGKLSSLMRSPHTVKSIAGTGLINHKNKWFCPQYVSLTRLATCPKLRLIFRSFARNLAKIRLE